MTTSANKLNVKKPTSPAKTIDSVVNNSWDAQNRNGSNATDPKAALNQKYNEQTVKPESMK